MTKKTFNLISIFIVAIFLLALSYFVSGILIEKLKGEERADSIFQNLAQNTQMACSKYALSSNEFSNLFIKSIGNLKNYEKITLKLDDEILFSYPKNVENSKAKNIKNYSAKIKTNQNNIVELDVSIFKLNPNLVFNYAKNSFFIILIGTLISFAFLIFAKTDRTEVEISIADENSKKIEINSHDEQQEPFLTEEEKKVLFEDEEDKKENIQTQNLQLKEEFIEDKKIENKITIKREESLLANLEEALIESVAKDEDFSVLIVRSEFFKKDENFLEDENLEILNCFDGALNLNCSVYEYGSFGYAIFIKNSNLDQSVALSEKLLEKINNLIAKTNKSVPVTMGISARAGRTLSGERILKEASEAEKHAQNEPSSPIIAFRINPEKYKNFILNNN
ncbi:nucleotidyl cyclase domain-containing protein [Treponema pectinovorum]|uniref:hypothetical protein n=1 Tax=Treponema pectinovorum TaxID=164 RepID=UPI0011CA8FC9|nr:hypothetical protein [Treponema pectinovorum]